MLSDSGEKADYPLPADGRPTADFDLANLLGERPIFGGYGDIRILGPGILLCRMPIDCFAENTDRGACLARSPPHAARWNRLLHLLNPHAILECWRMGL